MKLSSFCTIITYDYLPYALALHESLINSNDNKPSLFILVASLEKEKALEGFQRDGITLLFCDNLCTDGIGKRIKEKYFNENTDNFRWSMKPVLINYLIKQRGLDKVIYLDCDLHFFSDYKFLFDRLEKANVLLTPHWRSSNPYMDKNNFAHQYNQGLFNGGFVGVNKKGTDAMDWWAMACEYICIKDPRQGQYVDQTHLNLLPIYFEQVEIVRHRGCNVANWNQVECKRVLRPDGSVWINDQYPIVFIHFTPSTIKGIIAGDDSLLLSNLKKFSQSLIRFGWPADLISQYHIQYQKEMENNKRLKTKIKNKLKKGMTFLLSYYNTHQVS